MGKRGAGRFEEFVRRYGERAFKFAYSLSGNIDEAKDLVQEAFYHALRGWGGCDAARSREGWFFTILRHVFLDGRRRYWRRNVLPLEGRARQAGEGGEPEEPPAGEEEGVLELLERREKAELVREALEELSFEHRSALVLCDVQGLSYAETAKVLRVPLGTVRSRVNRARAALRSALASRLELSA